MSQKLPPMQALLALDAFERLGTAWQAAEELGITRSAVSHRLALLEETLGFGILERSGKGTALTSRGKRYALSVRRSLSLIAEAGKEDRTPIEGTLRISSTAGFASMWLCQHIARFHEEHPNLSLEICTRRELDNVSDPTMHVFIAFGDGNWPNYLMKRLYDVEYLPVCSPTLLNSRGGLERPPDVLRFPLLHLHRRDDWSRWLATNGVEVAKTVPGILFSDMMLIQSAALAGQGIMMGDNVTCAALLSAGQLVCPFSTTISAPGSYYLVIDRRQRRNPAVQAFSSWIETLIRQLRPDSSGRRGVGPRAER
ncbi:MAG TPA: LysR substrate-binding domain-containing protein [Steroidobacteraceae bacterium]|nr:LysR substrate-binding domain-containing protein [Steroidobacteraceae bacterium]